MAAVSPSIAGSPDTSGYETPLQRVTSIPDGLGTVRVTRMTSNAQISSLRAVAQKLGLIQGCELALLLRTDNGTASVRHVCASGTCLVVNQQVWLTETLDLLEVPERPWSGPQRSEEARSGGAWRAALLGDSRVGLGNVAIHTWPVTLSSVSASPLVN